MISYNPLLCLDFYKTAHAEQYPVTLTKMVSYYTPRMTRLADTDKVTMFGLQAFIQEYLIEAFNDHFFNHPLEEVLGEYERVLKIPSAPAVSAEGASLPFISWATFRWKFGLSRRALEPILKSPKLRSRIPTPILCGWSTPLRQCYRVLCGILRSRQRWDTGIGRSSISMPILPVTMMWCGPSSWETSQCAAKRA